MRNAKEWLIHWLARQLLPFVGEKDVIAFDKQGGMYIDGEKCTATEVANLKAEINYITKTRIWHLMNVYFMRLAQKKLYEEAKDTTDLLIAKSVLYTLDVQAKIVDKITKLK